MRINNNVMAMNSHRQLNVNNVGGQKSMEKLSSGFRVNRAGDDAAGLAISEKMRGQIRGLTMASKNSQDGISLIQTAEGALNETHAMLQRMRELAVQSANDTNTSTDRAELQKEVTALIGGINDIASRTEFNTMKLLDGSFSGKLLQTGANTGQTTGIKVGDMSASGISVGSIDISTQSGAATAIGTINSAIEKVSSERADLGAIQNRLEYTIKNLDNTAENIQAAESRIRDVDMAREVMTFTKQNILSQAATAMLAQANMAPQSVLQLLG